MSKAKQCIAWDGKMLAILEHDVTGHHVELITRGLTHGSIAAGDIDGGAFGTVVMAALSTPNELKMMRKLFESQSLPEVIAFYQRAVSIGLVGLGFEFQFMAVIKNRPAPDNYPRFGEYYAVAIEVKWSGMSVHYSQDYNCLAVGASSYAAMLLMKDGFTAAEAVTAQTVLESELSDYQMYRRGVSYDAEKGTYSYTSFHEAKEKARSLPFYHVDNSPKTQKEIDDSF